MAATAHSGGTSLAPYQSPDGLAHRNVLAHARDHIEKLQKRHEQLRGTVARAQKVALKQAHTLTQMGFTVGTAGALGLVNGRYGGDKGYLAPWGVPVDFAVGGAAHVAGFVTSVLSEDDIMEPVIALLHTIGDAGLGVGVYRWAHQKGAELAARSAGATGQAGVGANSAHGGTVYAVPATHP
jgi:hypothetical protein